MKKLFEKYREIIAYLFFGVVTTAVSWGVHFAILTLGQHLLRISPSDTAFNAVRVVAEILQWIAGVTVAFFTNKKWVFNASGTTKKETSIEFSKFAIGRLGTFGLEFVLYFGGVWLLRSDLFAKIISSAVVVISNYVISKFLVFKKST